MALMHILGTAAIVLPLGAIVVAAVRSGRWDAAVNATTRLPDVQLPGASAPQRRSLDERNAQIDATLEAIEGMRVPFWRGDLVDLAKARHAALRDAFRTTDPLLLWRTEEPHDWAWVGNGVKTEMTRACLARANKAHAVRALALHQTEAAITGAEVRPDLGVVRLRVGLIVRIPVEHQTGESVWARGYHADLLDELTFDRPLAGPADAWTLNGTKSRSAPSRTSDGSGDGGTYIAGYGCDGDGSSDGGSDGGDGGGDGGGGGD